MPLYSFRALDSAGKLVDGEIEAADDREVGERLRQRGLIPQQITKRPQARDVTSTHPPRLSAGEAHEVLGQLAQVSMANASLVAGLRAAASEASNYRVSVALRYVASEVARGRPTPDVLSDSASRMPAHVRGLVAAAMRTGRLGIALDELIEHQRRLRSMFWNIWGSLAYPLIVLFIAIGMLTLFLVFIVPPFAQMFMDFQLRLPWVTESLLFASESTVGLTSGIFGWVLLVLVSCLAIFLYLSATGHGGARIQRVLTMMPIFGPLWAWSGASSFMSLLATLLEHDVPLPEALRLVGDGLRNAELRRAAMWLAGRVSAGESFAESVEVSGCLPASAVPVLRWGEQSGVLAEAARTLAEMFAERVWARTTWLRSTSPTVIYLFVVMSVGFAVMSLFSPLVNLIQGLS